MSTTKPRITVTLEPRHHEVLSRLSAASGDSMSQIVSGFVGLAIPSLERVVVALERARAAPEEVRSGLLAALEKADREMMPLLEATSGQADMFLADFERAAEGPGKRKRAAEGESTPVPVTRGSGPGKTLTGGAKLVVNAKAAFARKGRRHGPV